jgi:LuxR family maltose regulon positive regulatory protein
MDATLPTGSTSAQPRRPTGGLEVPRTRLLRRLAAAERPTIVLLRAPAGCGKSTVLAQWADTETRPCACVELRALGGGQPVAVVDAVAAIARAFDTLEPLAPEPLAALTGATSVDRPLLRTLAGLLAARPAPLVLMLDDAHLLRGHDAAVLLELLAARGPPDSLLVLAAREEPALPLARLRADGLLLELSAAQLALDEQESALLLAHAGLELAPEEARALLTRTEGWPAGLVLAARALRESDAPHAALADFSGADGTVAAYVREQLLAGLAPAERELLLRCAPLDRLSGELCDAVLRRRGSGLALRELAHGNVPLAPLDRAERSFRLHPLVTEALLSELRRTDAAWETQAHRRASAWHERRGDLARAIDHAIAAGDAPHAAALIRATLPAQALCAGSGRLSGWLDRLGRERIEATPDLALAAALERLAAARSGDAARLAAAASPDAGGRIPASPDDARRSGPAIARALLAMGSGGPPPPATWPAPAPQGLARMRADAEQGLSGCTRPGWRALASLAVGVADQLAGRTASAQERLEDGAWHAGSLPLVQALCLAQLALLAIEREEPQRAVMTARQARATLEQAQLAQMPLSGPVAAIAAFAEACGGSLEQARAALAHVRDVLPADAELPPWLEIELRFALARTRLQLADAAGARSELTRMSRALRRLPDAVAARAWIEDAWVRADAFAASSVRGPARLTLAELRVLRLLPSHLSLREIATRLHVSANTVKTQAQAVYRKLDVSSRSEAVARAREVGLVDGVS